MVRAIAKQAEAERERRAKVIIHAEGELQASQTRSEAAKILAQQTQALQPRYLQTLSNITTDKSSTIVSITYRAPESFSRQYTIQLVHCY